MDQVKSTTKKVTQKSDKGFSDFERAAMKERARELKARCKQGGRGKRRARQDRRDAGTGPVHGRTAPCNHQRPARRPLTENLVRDARVCKGRQGRLLLPECAEVQNEVLDLRFQRRWQTSTKATCGRWATRLRRIDLH